MLAGVTQFSLSVVPLQQLNDLHITQQSYSQTSPHTPVQSQRGTASAAQRSTYHNTHCSLSRKPRPTPQFSLVLKNIISAHQYNSTLQTLSSPPTCHGSANFYTAHLLSVTSQRSTVNQNCTNSKLDDDRMTAESDIASSRELLPPHIECCQSSVTSIFQPPPSCRTTTSSQHCSPSQV